MFTACNGSAPFLTIPFRDTVKNYFRIFSVKGGEYPPIPLSFFWAKRFFGKEWGDTPQLRYGKNPLKTAIFGQKTLILALFYPFFSAFFWRFLLFFF